MYGPAFWWTIVGIVLMILELAVPGLVLFFFGLGALATALLVLIFPAGVALQLIVFAIASLVSLFGLRRLLKPVFAGRASRAGSAADGIVGSEGKVTEAITPEEAGRIVVNGTGWKAESEESIEAGRAVVVVGQRSLTLIVKGK
ncbi:NfeD family protein [Pontiella sp.]|uniref:NfeD family protein n=1 Tax=Pontiella sp. TaxID=2837462 RepID=UPI00356616A4